MPTNSGWQPSPRDPTHSSAPHLPHELLSLTLYGPSFRTYQRPIWERLVINNKDLKALR